MIPSTIVFVSENWLNFAPLRILEIFMKLFNQYNDIFCKFSTKSSSFTTKRELRQRLIVDVEFNGRANFCSSQIYVNPLAWGQIYIWETTV